MRRRPAAQPECLFFFFSLPFYVFTGVDKAPEGFTIMLCRCSQQERVIAVGVWSSPRRFGSSGQSCQKLPEDPPGYTRVLPPSAGRVSVRRFVFACAANTRQQRAGSTCIRSPTAAIARHLLTTAIRPTCRLRDSDSGVPGTCQRHHTCPQDPAGFSTLWQQPCMSADAPGANWGGYGVTEERKSDKLGVI